MSHPEALLISAVLRTDGYINAISKGLNSDQFHSYRQEWLWIEKFYVRNQRLPSKATFRAKFTDFPLKAVDEVEHYVEEVQKSHQQFLLAEAVDKSLDLMEKGDVDGAISRLQGSLITIQSSRLGESSDFDLVADWATLYEDVKARVSRATESGMAGIPTGFPTLDNLTGGVAPGDYWIVAARLGQGKTWTLTRMAAAAMFGGYTVQYDALEQSKAQVAFRLQAFLSTRFGRECFSSLDLMKGRGFDLFAYKKFLKKMAEGNTVPGKLFIADASRGKVSPVTLAAQIERNHPNILFVDYITLLDQHGDDWRAIDRLSKDMKSLAQRYGIPIVCAAQINRAGEGREPPKAAHLSGADAIGQDADAVITMAQITRHVIKFRLAKYRHGPDGDTWYTDFSPNKGVYEEISGDKAEELMEADREED